MRYYGKPNLHVINYKKPIKEMFCFDESGVYETEDEKLIAWMKKNKPHIRCEEVEEAKEPKQPKEPEKQKEPKPKKPKSNKAKKPTK